MHSYQLAVYEFSFGFDVSSVLDFPLGVHRLEKKSSMNGSTSDLESCQEEQFYSLVFETEFYTLGEICFCRADEVMKVYMGWVTSRPKSGTEFVNL